MNEFIIRISWKEVILSNYLKTKHIFLNHVKADTTCCWQYMTRSCQSQLSFIKLVWNEMKNSLYNLAIFDCTCFKIEWKKSQIQDHCYINDAYNFDEQTIKFCENYFL